MWRHQLDTSATGKLPLQKHEIAAGNGEGTEGGAKHQKLAALHMIDVTGC